MTAASTFQTREKSATSSRLFEGVVGPNEASICPPRRSGIRVCDDGIEVQPIAERNEPSPVTRSGLGIGDAIKPELVDYGGTLVFNGRVDRLLQGGHWASAGMLTLSDDYRCSLFTAASGTSYAAPRVAYKAAQIVRRFPHASANMLLALLGLSAELPAEAIRRLQPGYTPGGTFEPAVRRCLGYGIARAERALASDDTRVVLLADRHELDLDQVPPYAVPLPAEFRQSRGRHFIRVALAFDPPTRHTRLEYLGTRMSFHLLHGLTPDQILEHYRRRDDGTRHPDIPLRDYPLDIRMVCPYMFWCRETPP